MSLGRAWQRLTPPVISPDRTMSLPLLLPSLPLHCQCFCLADFLWNKVLVQLISSTKSYVFSTCLTAFWDAVVSNPGRKAIFSQISVSFMSSHSGLFSSTTRQSPPAHWTCWRGLIEWSISCKWAMHEWASETTILRGRFAGLELERGASMRQLVMRTTSL